MEGDFLYRIKRALKETIEQYFFKEEIEDYLNRLKLKTSMFLDVKDLNNSFVLNYREKVSLKARSFIFVLIIVISSQKTHASNVDGRAYFDKDVKQPELLKRTIGKSNAIFHLFSHGKPGQLYIRDRWLKANEIVIWIRNNIELNTIDQLNIYGCEFGKGEKGKQAVNILIRELRIKVAASDDLTGKDGDWNLEVGNISHTLKVRSYDHTLQNLLNSNGWSYHNGAQYVNWSDHSAINLNNGYVNNGYVEQRISTIVGNRYTISFRAHNHMTNGYQSPHSLTLNLSIGNVHNENINLPSTPWNHSFTTYTRSFTANSTSTLVRLRHQSGGTYEHDILIDRNSMSIPYTRPQNCTAVSACNVSGASTVDPGQATQYSVSGGTPSNSTTWSISPSSGVSVANGNGTSTENIHFTNAGTYTVSFTRANTSSPSGCINSSSRTCTRTVTVSDPCSLGTDSDGDGIADDCDLDDDNDGILDVDELCPAISGATAPSSGNITWALRGFDVYTIGGNTDGSGYKKSGFERGAYNQGKNLIVLNGNNDFTASHSGDGTAILSSVTFANGTMKYVSNHPVNGRAEFRDTTADNFISGGSGDGAYIEPEMGPVVGDYYSIEIDFTTPVTAFSLDIIDAFDTFTDNNPVLKYQVYADGKLIAYLEGGVVGDDGTGMINIFDADGNSKGTVMVGHNIETAIGFVTLGQVRQVVIRHDVTSGFIRSISYDPHGLDSFAYSTDFCDTDNDGIANHLDVDSDADGCPDALESNGNSYNYDDLNGDGSLSGNVNTDSSSSTYGVPNSLNFTGGTSYDDGQVSVICDSCAPGNPAFVDSDGDGIGNLCDLDDDNDGITDVTECSTLPTRVISEALVVESGNASDLHTGDVLRKVNALSSNGVNYDVLVEIINENIPTGRLERTSVGGLRIAESDYKEHPFVEYKLTVVESGTTTPATLANVVSVLRDIDGSTNGGFVDVHGYESSQTVQVGPGSQLKPTTQDFNPSLSYTTYRTVTPNNMVSSSDPDYWVGLYHSTFSSGNFVFGVNETADTSTSTNRTIFHDLLLECDFDNDGIPNRIDVDSDNDGIYDITEAGTDSLDTNNDGRVDNMDNPSSGADTDGDGLSDNIETTNGDNIGTIPRETTSGTSDYLNADSDADGCSDANEAYDDPVVDGIGNTYYNPANATEPLTVIASTIDNSGKVVAASYTTGDVPKVTDKDFCVSVCFNSTNAINDFINTNKGQAVQSNVLTNDFDIQGDIQTVNAIPVGNPTNGTVNLSSNGAFTYQPNPGFSGQDSFTYEVCDDNVIQECSTAIVFIEVLPDVSSQNEAPIANTDTGVTLVNVNLTGNVITNDYDPDGDIITINTTPITNVSNGTLSLNTDGSYTYTPNTGFIGEDSFIYQICDTASPTPLCDTATVEIQILPNTGNTTIANDDAYYTMSDVVANAVNGNVLDNDFDPEGNTQVINETPVSNVGNGTLTLNANGTFVYKPNTGFWGQDSFVYETCDNGTSQACDRATVRIMVRKFLPPDYSPTLFTRKTVVNGNSEDIDFVVAVAESNFQDANGINPVEVRISDSSNFNFTFESGLTTLNGMAVDNSDWSYILEGGLHKFRFIGNGGIFPGNTLSKIGIKAVFISPGNSRGQRPLKVTVKSDSGGQTNTNNDNDEDIIQYNNGSN
ncbi:protein of unknown function [Tenacibaculum sp. MAR_2009_124]|uniref:Ig-like domain-containing protein n=1 Tax=Tenacibaculum sp. MAR_2009_124 TaxID=1250059 RepID=UPI00089CAEE6|nr:Ig-like domain-containing protein [Tenacibaculum sp. MAR_2009_124]SEC01422.1 protein of unknown function [Tenacibaculum sp. MAR_2009_124]